LAHIVVFLGFGFHHQNMAILKSRSGIWARPHILKVIASVKGIREENHDTLKGQLSGELALSAPSLLLPWSCHQMLTDLKLSIMAFAG
jgi:hypothetical protein